MKLNWVEEHILCCLPRHFSTLRYVIIVFPDGLRCSVFVLEWIPYLISGRNIAYCHVKFSRLPLLGLSYVMQPVSEVAGAAALYQL